MNIIIKLIGHFVIEDNNKYIYELKLFNVNITIISFDMIKTVLSSYGLEEEYFEHISITCDCKNIKNENIININNDDKKIYIYTCKENIKNELKELFFLHGYKTLVEPKINISLENNLQENNLQENNLQENNLQENNLQENNLQENNLQENNLLEDDLFENNFNEINEETIKTFEDNDFIFLIKIYLNKPNIFKKFFKYISSGNIILSESLKDKEIDNISLNKSLEFIKNLNMEVSDDIIIDALKKTNNHLNLSIRYILLKKIEQNI